MEVLVMKSVLTEEQKVLSYILNKAPNIGTHSQKKIGEFWGDGNKIISQSVISQAIKEVGYQKKINSLNEKVDSLEEKLNLLEGEKPLLVIADRVPIRG